jgi:hypothetical protein
VVLGGARGLALDALQAGAQLGDAVALGHALGGGGGGLGAGGEAVPAPQVAFPGDQALAGLQRS